MEPKHSLDPSGGPQSQSMETTAGGDNGIELKPIVNYNSDFVREQDAARQWTFNTIKLLFPEGTPSVNESTDDLTRTQGDGAAGEGDLEAQHGRRASTSYAASLYPRPDGGLHANAYLVSACMVEGLVWGFPFSYGVFEQYYSTHPPFNEDKSTVAEIGTTATGVMYLAGAITFPLYNKWPAFARFSTIAGLPIMSLALLAASFANKVWQLVLTQGVVYGSGGSIMYYASLMYLDDWFIKKKASAFGVVWAGSGAAGLIIPFLMNWLLNRYGPAITLRVWAVVLAVCSKPLMFTLKPRIPAHMSSAHKSYSFAFAKTSTFWILMLANIMQSFGYFLPGIYLPNFAESLGHPEKTGTLLVALLNVGGTCSSVIIGTMTENKDISKVITTSMVGAALTVFLLWGFGESVQQLCVFSLFYGLFAGGFTSTYPGIVKELRKTDPRTDNGLLVGLLSAGRGIGAIFSGPISERLLAATPPATSPTQGFDSQYGNLIIFTGVAHAVGSLVFVSKKLGWV